MNKIPFEYGSIAENEYFIDRIEDRRRLQDFSWRMRQRNADLSKKIG